MNRRLLIILMIVAGCAVAGYGGTNYVSVSSGNDVNDGSSWALAKAGVQAGVDVSVAGDTVLVSNGTYSISSPITISAGISVKSLNGPDVTLIDGGGLTRCVSIDHVDAVLDGMTVMNGVSTASDVGAGITMSAGTVTDCVVAGNSATNNNFAFASQFAGGVSMSGGMLEESMIMGNTLVVQSNRAMRSSAALYMVGGTARRCLVQENRFLSDVASGDVAADLLGVGVYLGDAQIENSIISSNTATSMGRCYSAGAVCGGYTGAAIVKHCTITGNALAFLSGGTQVSLYGYRTNNPVVANSIVYGNSGQQYYRGLFEYSCTTPLPAGIGNTASDPLFVGSDDFRLQSNSPCIDVGSMEYGLAVDYSGGDRVGVPDMGAYEYDDGSADLVTFGYPGMSVPPQLQVVSVSNRVDSNVIDIDYIVTDSDSAAVEVRGYAIDSSVSAGDVDYMSMLYPLSNFVEGTGIDYGPGVVPTSTVKHISWDAGTDLGASMAGMRLDLVATDTNSLSVSLHFVTIPADTNGPSFVINRYAGATSDYQLKQALLLARCRGSASWNGSALLAVGGAYDGQVVVANDELTAAGRGWLCEQIGGGVRLATAGEVTRAREATTFGNVTKWKSYYRPEMLVNEFGIDTTDDSAWYIVK